MWHFVHFFWSCTVTKRFDFFLLRCYCREPDHHLGDYPYNVHGNLKWNIKSHGRHNVELFWCNCAWNMQMSLMINTLQGGNTTSSGQHVGTASNMWKGKWFNLNRPGLISFNGRGGMIKIGQFLGPSIAGREYRDSSLDLWSSNELRFFSLKRILCRRLL